MKKLFPPPSTIIGGIFIDKKFSRSNIFFMQFMQSNLLALLVLREKNCGDLTCAS